MKGVIDFSSELAGREVLSRIHRSTPPWAVLPVPPTNVDTQSASSATAERSQPSHGREAQPGAPSGS
eukprot:7500105-Lingulodinium_polyedra.AAC.1